MNLPHRIPFAKMHASGNDFVIIDNRMGRIAGDVSELARKVCRRNYSVGADGLILIEKSDTADFKWQFYNSDGTVAEMCGNASRCVARLATMKGIAPRELSFETLAGRIRAEVKDDGVKVELTRPKDYMPGIKVELDGAVREGNFINTGVPHVVYFVDDVESVDVGRDGSLTRYHENFRPAGANANFVKVAGESSMIIRTYERGVEGETQACGTGAVAAALVAGAKKLVSSPVSLTTRGGNVLKVYYEYDGVNFWDVFLEGDAVLVFQGELEEGALI